MSAITDKCDHTPSDDTGTNTRATVRDIQENFTKTTSPSLSSRLQYKDSFSRVDKKLRVQHPFIERSNTGTDFTKISTVSRRLEDLRKKSSWDYNIGQGRDVFKNSNDDENEFLSRSRVQSSKINSLSVPGASDINEIENTERKSEERSEGEEFNVGFSSLPDQIYRKSLKKGFHFVILVTGESGLGKSTLINSLFLTDVYSSPSICNKIEKTTCIREHEVQLEENGVKLSLTVVDTPGFGDAVDNSDCWSDSIEYIDSQFDTFLHEETRVHRTKLPDKRVHACLYFISPNGHGLKNIDIECMRRLHQKVNIIPVIGKADACTSEELIIFKKKIRNQLRENDIDVYQFPREENDEVYDSLEKSVDEVQIREANYEEKVNEEIFPFAVVGSNTIIEDASGSRYRGRKYPWGCVNIEDQNHSDFSLLRKLLLCHHTQDLIDTTAATHYENYRYQKLSKFANEKEQDRNKHPLAAIEEDKQKHEEKMNKMEEEMDKVLEVKVNEKTSVLQQMHEDSEEEVKKEQELLDFQKAELSSRRDQFDREKIEWATRLRLYSSKSSESLSKRKHFRLSVGAFKFGRQ